MIDLKETLTDIARALVDSPDEVTVIESVDGNTVNLTLSVAADDMGMVIGRHGKIAKAIRTVMKAAANSCDKRVNVEIK
ncbi:MAG: KH domain-containing protein [Ruminococcaceae bacterium]|nr:KH domain-containing protein [Oscillospiraceae bacterium]